MKIKFNWGTGIAITLVVFASLMGFMVYQAMQQDFDLVSETYYEDELLFQDVINQKTNALRLSSKAALELNENDLFLNLPEDLVGKEKDIKILMYCSKEADNDFNLSFEKTSENVFKIPFTKFNSGKWVAKVKVNCEDVDYYFEPEIIL